jgi:hypothetical protein
MRTMLIALCAASLAACDGLSTNHKKPLQPQSALPAAASSGSSVAPQPQDPNLNLRLEADKALALRVKQALEKDAKALAAGIDVTADGGVVTLWGTTMTDIGRGRVAKVASGVDGVKSVENRIAVVKGS